MGGPHSEENSQQDELRRLRRRIDELETSEKQRDDIEKDLRKKAEDEIEYRMSFERLLTSISSKFINLPISDMDQGIVNALESVGKFADMDQGYVFLFSR